MNRVPLALPCAGRMTPAISACGTLSDLTRNVFAGAGGVARWRVGGIDACATNVIRRMASLPASIDDRSKAFDQAKQTFLARPRPLYRVSRVSLLPMPRKASFNASTLLAR